MKMQPIRVPRVLVSDFAAVNAVENFDQRVSAEK
jgi:hypothetical protein